jgi:hypothetical protein
MNPAMHRTGLMVDMFDDEFKSDSYDLELVHHIRGKCEL